ncbi:MAG: trypsin-like peptidase domain-containing protein [Verrucomicrobiota bacterium]|nr:trypsin-like peptidase domain-containing protein [Verrucomicrobiota bacterium]
MRLNFIIAPLLCSSLLGADRLELKENAAITGQILSQKKDHVAIDVGYTVLNVPTKEILKVIRGDAPPNTNTVTKTMTQDGALYRKDNRERPEKPVRELVAELGEAVVQVRTPDGLGSGFFINEEGYLITNFHVIEGETQISIEVYHQRKGQLDRRSYKDVRIIAMNKFADLALLHVEDKDAPEFKWVPLGESSGVLVGEAVFAIGSPLGLERTVTEGIISTKTRELFGELYMQTTAQINPGNSGGPLFNLRGEVVGVTNMKLTFGEGLGFCIPVQGVKDFLTNRDAFAYDNDNPSNPYRYLDPPRKTSARKETK